MGTQVKPKDGIEMKAKNWEMKRQGRKRERIFRAG
jgi:hypothetical protein